MALWLREDLPLGVFFGIIDGRQRLFLYGVLAWPTAYLLTTAKLSPFAKLKTHGEFRG